MYLSIYLSIKVQTNAVKNTADTDLQQFCPRNSTTLTILYPQPAIKIIHICQIHYIHSKAVTPEDQQALETAEGSS